MIGWIVFVAALLAWLGCGYISSGYWYSYMNREFPGFGGQQEYGASLVCCFIGPIALICDFIESRWRKHGICWNWITKPVLTPPSSSLSGQGWRIRPGGVIYPDLAEKEKDLPKVSSTEPIIGYRVWNLSDGYLKSCTQNFIWPLRKRIEKDMFKDAGIHAVKFPKQLTHAADSLGAPMGYSPGLGLWQEYGADVAGAVYLWGEIKECELGYLAQYAYPKELYMPEDTDPLTVMQLEENYGVPVILRPEFTKRITENVDWAPTGGWTSYKFSYNIMPPFAYSTCSCGYTWTGGGACPSCFPLQGIQGTQTATAISAMQRQQALIDAQTAAAKVHSDIYRAQLYSQLVDNANLNINPPFQIQNQPEWKKPDAIVPYTPPV